VSEENLDGRQSSIEGDSSEGGEEVSSMEERDLEEMLGWPLEMLFTPVQSRNKRSMRETAAMERLGTERSEGGAVDVDVNEGGDIEGRDKGGGRHHDSMAAPWMP
jgi:hypothetical protein